MSPQDLPKSPLASSDPEEVLKLECPSCLGVLNLRRKHMGIEGKCVHCSTPVTAVESGAGVVLEKKGSESEEPFSQQETAVVEEVVPEEAEPVVPEVAEPVSKETDASSWGFPNREETGSDAGEAPAAMPDFSILTGKPHEPAEKVETPTQVVEPQLEDPFPVKNREGEEEAEQPSSEVGFESESLEEPIEKAIDQPLPAEEEKPFGEEENAAFSPLESGLPQSGNILDDEGIMPPPASALFGEANQPENVQVPSEAEGEGEGNGGIDEGWGSNVPTQNHASISPFSTGSANEDLGFAETLFAEGTEKVSAQIEPKSPFGEPESKSGGALFADPMDPPAQSESDEPVVLDGDGRPMAPMTDEEKEAFAQEMMQVGDYHKRSPWVRRIRKFFITFLVLGGIGYAGYVFMPEDLAKEWKAKVIDWLEPGSVLKDFLPFELEDVPEGEEGEKRVKIKAIEGLNQLTNEMDAYLEASEQNLRESGAKIPEREKKEQMEMPDIPNIPKIPKLPFKLPSGGGAAPAGE